MGVQLTRGVAALLCLAAAGARAEPNYVGGHGCAAGTRGCAAAEHDDPALLQVVPGRRRRPRAGPAAGGNSTPANGCVMVDSLVINNYCNFAIDVFGFGDTPCAADPKQTCLRVEKQGYAKVTEPRRGGGPPDQLQWTFAWFEPQHQGGYWMPDFIELNSAWDGPGSPICSQISYSNYAGFSMSSSYMALMPGSFQDPACNDFSGLFDVKVSECIDEDPKHCTLLCPEGYLDDLPQGHVCPGDPRSCRDIGYESITESQRAIYKSSLCYDPATLEKHQTCHAEPGDKANYVNYWCGSPELLPIPNRTSVEGSHGTWRGCMGKHVDFSLKTCVSGDWGR